MRVGEIISRINDAVKIRAFINNVAIDMLVNIFIVIFSFSLMFTYYWKLALVILVIIPFYLGTYALMNRFNDGLVVDGKSRISVKNSLQGSLILGPTGFSKTTAYIVPNLLKIKNGSLYVIDPSQELFDLTHKYLEKHFNVLSINLIDTKLSSKWNPLYVATTKEDMQMIADAMVSTALPDTSGGSTFWLLKNLVSWLFTGSMSEFSINNRKSYEP